MPINFNSDVIQDSNDNLTYAGFGTIASAAVCDIGSIPQPVVTVTGTVPISSFGSSLLPGQTRRLIIAERGLKIVVGANLVMNIGRAASYWSQPGDVIECIKMDSGVTHCTLNRADGISSCSPINSGRHPGTGIGYLSARTVGVYSAEMTLLKVKLGDMNQVGIWPSHALRLTNVGFADNQVVCSLDVTGPNGLDVGVVEANTDYYLWCISNGQEYQLNWTKNTIGPQAPSGWDDGEIYATMLYWNRTNASKNLKPIIKFGNQNFYIYSGAPIIFQGTNGGMEHKNFTNLLAPGSGAYQKLCVRGGNAGKFIRISADPNGLEFYKVGNGTQYDLQTEILGYMGGFYVHSNDPGCQIRLFSFIDVF